MWHLRVVLVIAVLFCIPLAQVIGQSQLYPPPNGLTLTGQCPGGTLLNVNAGATDGSTCGNAIQAPNVLNAVNDFQFTATITGSDPSFGLASTLANGATPDTNRNINISAAGTGLIKPGTLCTITGSSPQTCNGQRGIVTTGTLTTAAATDATYTINNSSVSASSLIMCTVQSYSGTYGTAGDPIIESCVAGSTAITVNLRNVNASNALNGAVGIGFIVWN